MDNNDDDDDDVNPALVCRGLFYESWYLVEAVVKGFKKWRKYIKSFSSGTIYIPLGVLMKGDIYIINHFHVFFMDGRLPQSGERR